MNKVYSVPLDRGVHWSPVVQLFAVHITNDENTCRVDVQVQVLGVDRYTGVNLSCNSGILSEATRTSAVSTTTSRYWALIVIEVISCNSGLLSQATRTSAVSTTRSRYWVLIVILGYIVQLRYFIRNDENICRVDVQIQVLGVASYTGLPFHAI